MLTVRCTQCDQFLRAAQELLARPMPAMSSRQHEEQSVGRKGREETA